jgi:hypothetical protein
MGFNNRLTHKLNINQVLICVSFSYYSKENKRYCYHFINVNEVMFSLDETSTLYIYWRFVEWTIFLVIKIKGYKLRTMILALR